MTKAIIFDAFGTLFNLDKSLVEDIEHPRKDEILEYARSKQLSYTWLNSMMGRYISFEEITKQALQDGCAKFETGLSLANSLGRLYFEPVIFNDVVETLKNARVKNIETGILSNGTHKMLQSGIQLNKLTDLLDHILSVDDIDIYKPSLRVYQMVIDATGLPREQVLFASSNQWDVAGAAHFGFQVAWVNRGQHFRESITRLPNVKEIRKLTDLLGLAM